MLYFKNNRIHNDFFHKYNFFLFGISSDGLSHSAKRLSESHRLDLLRNITELLGRTFSSQFVFPVLGHEDVQNNDYKRLGELWRHWLPSEALQTFEKGKRAMRASRLFPKYKNWKVSMSLIWENTPGLIFFVRRRY